MSGYEAIPYEERTSFILSPRNLARIIRNRRNGWRSARLDFIPYLDHGPATLSLTPSVPEGTADIAVALGRMELNQTEGRPLDEGLSEDMKRKIFGPSANTEPF